MPPPTPADNSGAVSAAVTALLLLMARGVASLDQWQGFVCWLEDLMEVGMGGWGCAIEGYRAILPWFTGLWEDAPSDDARAPTNNTNVPGEKASGAVPVRVEDDYDGGDTEAVADLLVPCLSLLSLLHESWVVNDPHRTLLDWPVYRVLVERFLLGRLLEALLLPACLSGLSEHPLALQLMLLALLLAWSRRGLRKLTRDPRHAPHPAVSSAPNPDLMGPPPSTVLGLLPSLEDVVDVALSLCVLDWLYHPALPSFHDEEEVFPLTGHDYHPTGMALLWTCALGLGVSSDTDTAGPSGSLLWDLGVLGRFLLLGLACSTFDQYDSVRAMAPFATWAELLEAALPACVRVALSMYLCVEVCPYLLRLGWVCLHSEMSASVAYLGPKLVQAARAVAWLLSRLAHWALRQCRGLLGLPRDEAVELSHGVPELAVRSESGTGQGAATSDRADEGMGPAPGDAAHEADEGATRLLDAMAQLHHHQQQHHHHHHQLQPHQQQEPCGANQSPAPMPDDWTARGSPAEGGGHGPQAGVSAGVQMEDYSMRPPAMGGGTAELACGAGQRGPRHDDDSAQHKTRCPIVSPSSHRGAATTWGSAATSSAHSTGPQLPAPSPAEGPMGGRKLASLAERLRGHEAAARLAGRVTWQQLLQGQRPASSAAAGAMTPDRPMNDEEVEQRRLYLYNRIMTACERGREGQERELMQAEDRRIREIRQPVILLPPPPPLPQQREQPQDRVEDEGEGERPVSSAEELLAGLEDHDVDEASQLSKRQLRRRREKEKRRAWQEQQRAKQEAEMSKARRKKGRGAVTIQLQQQGHETRQSGTGDESFKPSGHTEHGDRDAGGCGSGSDLPSLEDEDEEEARADFLNDSVPDHCRCPLTLTIMADPVLAADGHAYERSEIERWMDRCRAKGRLITSPLHGHAMESEVLVEDVELRREIERQAAKARKAWRRRKRTVSCST